MGQQVNEAAAAATTDRRRREAPFGALLTFDTFMEVKSASPARDRATEAPRSMDAALASVRSLHGYVLPVCCPHMECVCVYVYV